MVHLVKKLVNILLQQQQRERWLDSMEGVELTWTQLGFTCSTGSEITEPRDHLSSKCSVNLISTLHTDRIVLYAFFSQIIHIVIYT